MSYEVKVINIPNKSKGLVLDPVMYATFGWGWHYEYKQKVLVSREYKARLKALALDYSQDKVGMNEVLAELGRHGRPTETIYEHLFEMFIKFLSPT